MTRFQMRSRILLSQGARDWRRRRRRGGRRRKEEFPTQQIDKEAIPGQEFIRIVVIIMYKSGEEHEEGVV